MKIIALVEDWTEIPLKIGTIQPSWGRIEIEASPTKPLGNHIGVIVERGEAQSFNSVEKMWVRAIGTKSVVCNYGGF